MPYYKAFIRVIKSLKNDNGWEYVGERDVITEPVIEADDKSHVKRILLEMYPQFFQNGKIYEKETKDQAQFFYVVIFPLYSSEIQAIKEGEWTCSHCGSVHENKYVERPFINRRMFGDSKMFCNDGERHCYENHLKEINKGIEMPDDPYYVKHDSPIYIYRVTEKETGKCYIGKTKNAPFFRWWNHLTKSSSPFGLKLSSTPLSNWSFEVLEVLPYNMIDKDVLAIESKYMLQYDSLKNGYNSVISNKYIKADNQPELFDHE